jgi:hypothetical protein
MGIKWANESGWGGARYQQRRRWNERPERNDSSVFGTPPPKASLAQSSEHELSSELVTISVDCFG